MTVFFLKITALLSMVTDHISYVLTLAFGMNTPLLFHMRAIGRAAFPIYAFLLVNGFEKTLSKKAYLERLLGFALISQIPFSLAFSRANYMKAGGGAQIRIFLNSGWQRELLPVLLILVIVFIVLYRCRIERELILLAAGLCMPLMGAEICGVTLLGSQLNVFYTLAVSFALVWFLDILIKRRRSYSAAELVLLTAACLALALYILPRSDYGYRGFVLIAALYLAGGQKVIQLAVLALWSAWMYSYSSVFLIGALAACVPIAFYSGRLGKKMKLGFYLVYPVHLTVLFLLVFILC